MSICGRPTTTNGQRSRNLSKQRAGYFPRKAFRVEGKQIQFIKKQKMTQNYKIYLCALLLVRAVSMMPIGAQAAPKLAVLVVGVGTDAASDAFATGIGYEITQKGLYELVTAANNTAVKTRLTALRQQYAQNIKVDTAGLAAWGKEKGLDFVQLVVESDCSIIIGTSTPVSGRELLSQVVSCSTAKYSGRPTYRTRFVPNLNQGEGLEEMVFVDGGIFEMGCKGGRDNKTTPCNSYETPVHYVRVNKFYIGKYAVTQGLWKKVMGSLPSGISGSLLGDDKPVVCVSWDDITNTTNGFLKMLNAQTGKNYRLPTSAEWEYAARGCNSGICESFEYSGSNSVEDVAWYSGNSSSSLHTVGQKPPNALGLYDMSGNVDEWCSDWYSDTDYPTGTTVESPQDNPTGPTSGSYRIVRGGTWDDNNVMWCRVAYRYYALPNTSTTIRGFRLVLP
jgi:formylglycine-generating enzyme required for sulfatase activity